MFFIVIRMIVIALSVWVIANVVRYLIKDVGSKGFWSIYNSITKKEDKKCADDKK